MYLDGQMIGTKASMGQNVTKTVLYNTHVVEF